MSADGRRSLEGVRVIDFTMAWAGPFATRVLAELGADVIKIEGPARMDRWRGGTTPQRGTARYPDGDPGARPYDRNAYFNEQNLGKRGVAIDLKSPRGVEIARDLIRTADAVVENFGAGTFARMGFEYSALAELRPGIVLVSMPGFGSTGPESRYIAHGPTIEAMAGIAALQGYPDGPPMTSGAFAWGDPVAGMVGAGAVLAALAEQRATGIGQHVDVSHLEAAMPMSFEALLDRSANGAETPRRGNASASAAPHGLFPCRGEDRWVAISVRSDDEWLALVSVVGPTGLPADAGGWTVLDRLRHGPSLHRWLSAWTADREHQAVAASLQNAGVPAGAVLDAAELVADRGLIEQGYYRDITHPAAGTHAYPSLPWKLQRHRIAGPVRPAPCFGEHNNEVLTDVLGFTDDHVAELYELGVIARAPVRQGD